MTRTGLLLSIALVIACESNPKPSPNDHRVAAARVFTQQYTHSRLAEWNVRASAAGRDCDVLLVATSVILDDSMVEALHYGGGAYSVDGSGGVEHFCRRKAFRGVAYKDSTARVWTYGVSAEEVQKLKRCD